MKGASAKSQNRPLNINVNMFKYINVVYKHPSIYQWILLCVFLVFISILWMLPPKICCLGASPFQLNSTVYLCLIGVDSLRRDSRSMLTWDGVLMVFIFFMASFSPLLRFYESFKELVMSPVT